MESGGSGGADSFLIEEMMELTAQSLLELEINDRFDVIKEIGRGKYGRVLLVTHRCKGTPMALKVLDKACTKLNSFLREYCTVLSLSHPSIVALFGIAFQSDLHYCFAQELTGQDLLSCIRPKVGLPEDLIKSCAGQISSALEFIHARGLVHRDVKPENVLLLDAHCSRVKLADFGLAQRQGALIHFISGTLPYMSPELCARALRDGRVVAPSLPVMPSLDTWAFGVLLFCALTGCFPWESATPGDSFYEEFREWAQEEGPLGEGSQGAEPVPALWTRFSPDALHMFRRLLALEPEQRSSVSAVKDFLEKEWLTQTLPTETTQTGQATPP